MILIGDGKVGKTSLCSNLRTKRIPGTYELTVGLNIEVHKTLLRNTTIKLVLWDLAGQERFGCIRGDFYYGACVAIIVFDLQNRGSFFGIKHWVRELQFYAKNTPIILVGNKNDIFKREVTREEGELLARELNAPYFETSALKGNNVEDVFKTAARIALKSTAVAY